MREGISERPASGQGAHAGDGTRGMRMALQWERIQQETDGGEPEWTMRARVPGGWLVCVQSHRWEGVGLTFLPDPDHEWAP